MRVSRSRSRTAMLICSVLIVYALWSAFNTMTNTTVDKKLQWKIPPVDNDNKEDVTAKRGMVLCVGNEAHFINGALYTIQQLRQRWKSDLPVSIVHCNELYTDALVKFAQYAHVRIENICDPLSTTPLTKQQRSRLKGWFCKPQALLSSMYDETMIVDTDVLWFKDPTALFQAPSYRQTGALFFRDRFLFESEVEKDGLQYDKVKHFVETQSALEASSSKSSSGKSSGGSGTDSGSSSIVSSSSSSSDHTNSLSVRSNANNTKNNGGGGGIGSGSRSINGSSSEARTSARTRGGGSDSGSSSGSSSGSRVKTSSSTGGNSSSSNSTHNPTIQSFFSSYHQEQGSVPGLVLRQGLVPGTGTHGHGHHHHGLNFSIDASIAALWYDIILLMHPFDTSINIPQLPSDPISSIRPSNTH